MLELFRWRLRKEGENSAFMSGHQIKNGKKRFSFGAVRIEFLAGAQTGDAE